MMISPNKGPTNRFLFSFLAPVQPLVYTIVWTRFVYFYLLVTISFALFASTLLHNKVLLFALDGVLFFPIFILHIAQERLSRLFKVASFWGIFKSFLFILVIIVADQTFGSLVVQGPAYHEETVGWILYGEGIIAHPEEFIPLHILGVFRVIMSTVATGGLTTLIFGSRELNVMNYHVATLIGNSHTPIKMIFVAWPIWSLLRGWAYLCLMIGSAHLFLVIIRRRPLNGQLTRNYLLLGLLGSVVDVGLKVAFAPFWREMLQSLL